MIPPAKTKFAIEVSGLWKIYENPKVEALRGVDFCVERGRCVGVLGPNGSGKTTLIEIMQGVRQPTRGSVSIFGMNYQDNEKSIRTKIGGILQDNGSWARLRVAEILELFASMYPNAVSIAELSGRFALQNMLRRSFQSLSGGERQRVFLALALIGNPEVIFLDEPTTGLDPRSRTDFWNHIIALKAAGSTIVLTTHYLEEAEALCDEIAIVKNGVFLARGTAAELSLLTVNSETGAKEQNLHKSYLAITSDGEI